MESKSTNLGYVLMLDVSGSMQTAMEQVIINAQAFVACSFAGDLFAVCQFNDKAKWVYPEGAAPGMATVSKGLAPEVIEACRKIAGLQAGGNTNIGAAIELANKAIATSDAAFNAFVLLSDGEHNEGPKPETVLSNTPPLFVAGLGNRLNPVYFNPMVAKNTQSRYHPCPHFSDMMLIFNEIRGMIPGVDLLVNRKESWLGKGNSRVSFHVPASGGQVRAAVVWPAQKYRYTAQNACGTNIRVFLVNPQGESLKTAPWLTQDGFCIFDLEGIQEGEWSICCEYDLQQASECTFGVFYSA